MHRDIERLLQQTWLASGQGQTDVGHRTIYHSYERQPEARDIVASDAVSRGSTAVTEINRIDGL